jgi:hypothetical protein
MGRLQATTTVQDGKHSRIKLRQSYALLKVCTDSSDKLNTQAASGIFLTSHIHFCTIMNSITE